VHRERAGRQRAGLHPSSEQMEKLKKAYARYSNPNVPPDERPTQQGLSHEYDIPQATLSYWFRKFEQEGTVEPENMATLSPKEKGRLPGERAQKGKDRAEIVTERTTTREAIKSLSDRSKSTYAQAIAIGDLVTDKYGDLIKIAIAKGMKLEDFVTDVFNYYERREEIERQIHEQEVELAELRDLTDPNYRFKRKSQCILDFAKECLNVVKSGAHINPKQAARALQNDLNKIDEEIDMRQKIEVMPNG